MLNNVDGKLHGAYYSHEQTETTVNSTYTDPMKHMMSQIYMHTHTTDIRITHIHTQQVDTACSLGSTCVRSHTLAQGYKELYIGVTHFLMIS